VTFNVWTFLFEILNFLVLAFVLHRLLYRPLRSAVEERKAANEKARLEAEAARKEAETTRAELATKLMELDRERTDVLRKAAEQAEAEKARQLAEADATARSTREQARRDAEQLRTDTLSGLEGEVGQLAVTLAERLLAQSCDARLTDQLAHHLADALRRVTEEERNRVRQDAGTGEAVVESAAPLDDARRVQLAAAISELLGRACEVKFEVKGALVGGALVRAGGHVWDATIAAQLEAARAAVNEKRDGKPPN
jgi:F-type H+-transporting ATPase subunit b